MKMAHHSTSAGAESAVLHESPSRAPTTVTLVSKGEAGHRREYIELMRCLFAENGIHAHVTASAFLSAACDGPIFNLLIEDTPIAYVVTATLRALTRRRTVGLLFRPRECIAARSLRTRVKRSVLELLRRTNYVSTLSIIPEYLFPEQRRIAASWIYDPQLWDWSDAHGVESSALSQDILRAAGGRKILLAAGVQNEEKGFAYLGKILEASSDLREQYLVVAAGRVTAPPNDRARFTDSGGHLVDRFIEHVELASLYGVADLVWAAYSPEYDQASGIFGRAVQRGIPAVVREGSIIDALGDALGHPKIPVHWDDPRAAAQDLLLRRPLPLSPAIDVGALAELSRSEILKAIGAT